MNDNELKDCIKHTVDIIESMRTSTYIANLDFLTDSLLIDDIELNKDSKILIDEFLLSNLDSRTLQEIYLDKLINNYLNDV